MEPVEVTTADGIALRGEQLTATTGTSLVFVHDAARDIDDWRPLVDELAASGWGLLALDLRGHGGSEGAADASRYPLDVEAAVDLARRLGAEHVSVVATGLGALAALEYVARAIDEPRMPLADSLVLLSPGPLEGADRRRLRGEGLAKLIMSGAGEPQAADARAILQASIGWTVRVTFPAQARGTELLDGPFGGHVADKIATFLREQSVLGGPGLERSRLQASG